MARRKSALILIALALAASSPGCDDGREKHARADLEKAKARITAQMDRIAREANAPTVVVIEAVGPRPDDVAAVLVELRGLAAEDARAMLAGPAEAGEPVARSSPMGRMDAEALRDRLVEAGATARLEGEQATGAAGEASEQETANPSH